LHKSYVNAQNTIALENLKRQRFSYKRTFKKPINTCGKLELMFTIGLD